MNEVIGFCGLACSSCPIYLAGKETDPKQKEKMILDIIQICKESYGIDYRNEDITDCSGCAKSSAKMFSSCKDCNIRKCVLYKEIDNCAYCNDYPCENLSLMFKSEPAAKERLDAIREALFL